MNDELLTVLSLKYGIGLTGLLQNMTTQVSMLIQEMNRKHKIKSIEFNEHELSWMIVITSSSLSSDINFTVDADTMFGSEFNALSDIFYRLEQDELARLEELRRKEQNERKRKALEKEKFEEHEQLRSLAVRHPDVFGNLIRDYNLKEKVKMKYSEMMDLEKGVENIETRTGYLVWRQMWREAYKQISQEIRDLRACRKRYSWAYSNEIGKKRKTQIGDNPNYDPDASFRVEQLSAQANRLMQMRTRSKEIAREQYEARMLRQAA